MTPDSGDDAPYQNVEYLLEHGPAPAEALPTEVRARQRAVGVYSFTIQGGSGSDGLSLQGQLQTVYYLDDHSPETVISTFLETNLGLVDKATVKGLVRRFGGHGSEWRDAARTVLSEEYDLLAEPATSMSSGEPRDVKCWRCGTRISDLETHLSEDCSG
ncbi:hypothetical protein [Haloglomus halophilum]|uniref:hypothetical protein n=1 Tax=Haloglomus halophilum TaxID=2962672 RepID=UPI0020C9ADC4|nr:hypothetical protein [Haloglomus halophilum]